MAAAVSPTATRSPWAAPMPKRTMLPVITLVKALPSARNPIASVAPLVTASTTTRRSRKEAGGSRLPPGATGEGRVAGLLGREVTMDHPPSRRAHRPESDCTKITSNRVQLVHGVQLVRAPSLLGVVI